MPDSMLKSFASHLPNRMQQQLKRMYFSGQIKKNRFFTSEPEFSMLDVWVSEGDWVIDIGANIGHYTARLSELVGARGRVIAIEPVPDTFEILASNVACLYNKNVTLFNIAASDKPEVQGISIPYFDTGLRNYYQAELSSDARDMQVLCLPLDYIAFPSRIGLVKIDAENHDYQVLQGMENLIKRDNPVLIVENTNPDVVGYLGGMGYSCKENAGSPNLVFQTVQ